MAQRRDASASTIRSKRSRMAKVHKFIGDLLAHYEHEEEDWRGLTFLSIIRAGVGSLARYACDDSETTITWAHPIVLLEWEAKLDWEAFERGRGVVRTSEIDSNDLENHGLLSRKVAETFVTYRNLFLLSTLTNWVVIRREGQDEICLFTERYHELARSLPPSKARSFLQSLAEPYCIGVLLSSAREGRGLNGEVSKRFARRLGKFMREPLLSFKMITRQRTIRGHVFVIVEPLTADVEARKSFFPITIGIAFEDGVSPRFDRRQQRAFWSGLVDSLDEEIAERSVWDPGFLNQAVLWRRDRPLAKKAARKLLGIGDGRVSIHNVGHREFEELIAELYAGLGYRVRLTRASKDGGRDVIADSVEAISTRTIIECKRQGKGKPVGVLPVRALIGTSEDERPSGSILVSATGFTAGASDLAARHAHRVTLINEKKLLRLIERYRANQFDSRHTDSDRRTAHG